MSLEQEINDAIRDGLTGLTLWRVGASTIMWQSSTRWHGHDAFCVAIEPTPEAAIRHAIGQKPAKSARIKKAEPAPAPAAPAAQVEKKPSLDDWNDDATVAALDSATIPAADAFEW